MPQDIPMFPLGTVLFPGVVLPLHIFEPRYRALVRELMERDGGEGREFGVVAIRQGWEVGEHGATALYEVGCTAELRQVTTYDDGSYDIVTVGRRRFRLRSIDSTTSPYLRGSVDWIDAEDDSPADEVGPAESAAAPGAADGADAAPAGPSSVGIPPGATGPSSAAAGTTPVEARADEATVLARGVREVFARCRTLLRASQRAGDAARTGVAEASGLPIPDDPELLSYLVGAAAPLTLDDRQSLLAIDDTVGRLRRELRLLKREATMLSRLRAVPVSLAELRVPMSPN